MRALVLDELRPADVVKVREYLDLTFAASGVEGLYWVELDEGCLTETQAGHDECRPHRFAVELGDDFVRFEFLVRPAQGLRCPCTGYADEVQRRFILDMADRLITDLDLKT